MYAVTSFPFERRTRATFRRAEFGFFGVMVLTCRQTPRRWAHLSSTGDLETLRIFLRPRRTSYLLRRRSPTTVTTSRTRPTTASFIAGGAVVWVSNAPLRRSLRRQRRQVNDLEREVGKLKAADGSDGYAVPPRRQRAPKGGALPLPRG